MLKFNTPGGSGGSGGPGTSNAVTSTPPERESVKVLRECIDLQNRKAHDYQNPNSRVKQADHYLRGIDTIYDTMHGKMLRLLSLTETMKNDPNAAPKNESLEDTLKDLINYASFGVSWLRGKMEGQSISHDMFNQPIPLVNFDPSKGPTGGPFTINAESDYYNPDGSPKTFPAKGIAPRDKTEEWDMRTR